MSAKDDRQIGKALEVWINGLGDRGHFDAVQVVRGGSGDVPDEAGGVRAVVLGRASKRLIDEEALMPELGPERLDRVLRKFIRGDRPHLSLKDLWDYANRHVYLPRLRSRSVLVRTVETAVGNVLPGPVAYAEGWDEGAGTYRGLVIENAANAQIAIDSESVIVRPEIAEANRPAPPASGAFCQ